MFSLLSSMLLVLGACAPAVQDDTVPVSPLPQSVTQEQQGYFQQELKDLGITILSGSSALYAGLESTAFQKLVDQFYRSHPGYCPLENAFFIKDNPFGVYMTVTAKGDQIAAFIYDQRQKPRVTYSVLEGKSSQVLAVGLCRN
ncbi:hypothetical protein [Deinococcus roseus]|uniref:DUF3887 domain-containing protein n=1 Tax=Deinococcus roseus TaxID=392414 RepID=A0ABQ2D2J4_9DEIO|nr:hypothetical protein [Deinococcus roseus]GGJ33170.1 hypothetical protein GCM10008938_19260 [Deinococcus roseus]